MPQVADPALFAKKVAAFGLPGHEPDGGLSIEAGEWPSALTALCGRRITGLAVAGLEAGWLQLSAEQTEELLKWHRDAMLSPLAVERRLLEVAPLFEDAGLEFVVLKGPAVAHTVYPDPSWRFFCDLDLLVRAQDWPRACALLENLGFKRNIPDPRPGFVQRFGGAPAYQRLPGAEVDLHRTVVLGPFGLWVDTGQLFEWTSEFRLGDKSFRRLDDTSLLLHACIHASLGNWPPLTVPVRDVAQIANYAEVDWGAFAERSALWRLGSVVRQAFELAAQSLELPPPPEIAPIMHGSIPRKERRALQAYITDRRLRGGVARSTLSAIPGLRAKTAYVMGLLVPDQKFLPVRQGSYRSRWRVAFRWLRRRGGARRSA